ncbi:hypothetical protein ACFWJ4_22510 [Kitasatospora sp. NPDC127067]|uniref:hypothetical protein n=1 Tax=Kitasatospora sp. NPDC127067 TaxID=3347126 RepID=UPI00365DD85D
MPVVIAGGHGRVALLTTRLLTGRGLRVSGIIRRPEQGADVRAAGARPLVADPTPVHEAVTHVAARSLTDH